MGTVVIRDLESCLRKATATHIQLFFVGDRGLFVFVVFDRYTFISFYFTREAGSLGTFV